jgi:arylformamidase
MDDMIDDSGTSGQVNDPVFQYLTGQRNSRQPALLADFDRESEEAARTSQPILDASYGPHPRQRFDFFEAASSSTAIAYFHAGYWQSRDKAQFRFLAPTLLDAGFDVALVNYPLCPDVELEALTEAARAFVPAFKSFLAHRGRGPSRLIVAGHSAGAHLAVELALTDWRERGLSPDAIAAIVALSGVYDLTPLIDTPLNDNLRLTLSAARAASPLFRARGDLPPALFAVGAAETPAFRAQNEAMRAAWAAHGNTAEALIVEGADHFSLLRGLTTPGAPLLATVVALLERPEIASSE